VVLASTAVLALAVLLVNYRPTAPTSQEATTAAAPQNNATANADDQMLVTQVSQQNADVGKAYEASLKEINSYISDAEQAVNDDPGDSAAQEHLLDAYQQKAMLYEMATARALE